MQLSGSPLDYLFVFSGGVALSFTPCVYPLIPVTIGSIGVIAGGARWRGFLLSLVYVTGIAVTYSLMGLAAALGGRLFGSVSAHPAARLSVGAIFLVFGLSMFKVFAIYLPGIASLQRFEKNKNFFTILALGLTSGLVASPCVAPALGSILVYIGTTRNVFYGATLLMTFAYGLGTLLILVGTFSSILLRLPKSGKWMIWIERLSASVILAIGLYFVYDGIRRFWQ